MKSRKERPHITYLDGPFPIMVGYASSEKRFYREMKRLGIKDPLAFVTDGASATTHILSSTTSQTVCIVCLGSTKGKSPAQVYALMVHEAVHCWQETRKAMREEEPSSEFEAYTIQHYAQRFMEEFAANRRKR